MKNLFFLIVFFCAFSTKLNAQNTDAGVFYLYVKIEDELIDSRRVETKSSRSFLTGYSDRVTVPDNLLDTVRVLTAELVSKKLGVSADMLFLQDKKGRNRATLGMDIFPGMPFVNLKPAMKGAERKYYVKIYTHISPQAKATTSLKSNVSKNRPKVDMRVSIYDSNGKRYFSNKKVLRDFDVLVAKTTSRRKYKVTTSEVLEAEDIVDMYLLALEAVLFEK